MTLDEEVPFKKPHRGYFSMPCKWIPKDIARANEKVVVVSVFGHSSLDSNGYKTSPLELMLGSNYFNRDLLQPIELDEELFMGIKGYYDVDNRVIFLHLNGAFDAANIVESLEKLNEQLQEKGFLLVWSELRVQYARALLLLFSMSHILLMCHPNHIFDITYIHLFQTLDNVRSSISNHVTDILKDLTGITKDWYLSGRLCSPRVLFVFSSRLIPLHVLKAGAPEQNRYSTASRLERNANPIRKLELELEYQIYRLLRKCRVITNISYNSLFALPSNQPFVYVLEDNQDSPDPSTLIRDSLSNLCSRQDNIVSNFSKLMLGSTIDNSAYKESNHGRFEELNKTPITCLSDATSAHTLSCSLMSTIATERNRNIEHSFHLFLKQHLDEALTRGFDDSVVRHSGGVLFEVPKACVWFEAFNKLYAAFVMDNTDSENLILDSLRSRLETDIRFSDSRCAKALPSAISTYKDGLPKYYTQAHHQTKMESAMNILASQARGPMYDKYVLQLEEACEAIWRDGRMGCDTPSLTGNACQHPIHTVNKEEDSALPVMDHTSGVVYISFCNCGHRKAQLEDPFTAMDVNLDFYESLKDVCCGQLETCEFPTFKSSVVDAKAATVESNQDSPESSRTLRANPPSEEAASHSLNELSLGTAGLSQGMSSSNAPLPQRTQDAGQDSEIIVTVADDTPDEAVGDKDQNILRQASTTEYLPGMLTTTSPAGLLPRHSSWSLVCLGPSSLYSHNAGISEQPGFLSGTNFLLPWDVTIKIRDKDKWPAIADSMGKKGFLLKNKKNRLGDLSVKIFLGTEYQCIRGHRFMMSAPDKHLKATSLGHVKDTAVKVANANMPLYYPCPCSRSGQVINGQLIRIHVVTPKAPVHVTLNPQVQPAPDPCPVFIPQPSTDTTIKLSASAYWVLRLPAIYEADNGPYFPPMRQPTPASYGKLLKGCYGISEITLDR